MISKKEWDYFFRRPCFIIPLCIALLLSFGYGILHPAMGIDDLCRAHYTAGGTYIGGGRLGGWLIMMLLGPNGHTTFFQEGLGVLLLGLGAIFSCILFRRAAGERIRPFCYTLFACLFVSFPLNMNIWVYADTGFMVKLGYTLVPLSLLLMDAFFQGRGLMHLALPCVFMTLCSGMFESLAAVYIFYVGAYLTLQTLCDTHPDGKRKGIVRRGLVYAGLLVVAIMINSLLARFCMQTFSIEAVNQSTQTPGWLNARYTVWERIGNLIEKTLVQYFITGLFDWTLILHSAALLISVGVCVYALRINRPWAILPVAVASFSLFVLMVVRGNLLPMRTAQAFAPYTAFMFMLLSAGAFHCKRKATGFAVTGLICCLCLAQCARTNDAFERDYQRYEAEARVMVSVHEEILSRYDDPQKPVVFLYSPNFSTRPELPSTHPNDYVDRSNRLYEYLHGRLPFLDESIPLLEYPRNFIDWSIGAFAPNQEMFRFLQHLGYEDLKMPDAQTVQRASDIYKGLPHYPEPGYVHDAGDFILVRLG